MLINQELDVKIYYFHYITLMPKSQYIDPKAVRAAGAIHFEDIPVNQYKKTVKDELGNPARLTRTFTVSGDWAKYEFTLVSGGEEIDGCFVISVKGTAAFGYAFLETGEWGLYKGMHARRDVGEALENMGIGLLRFGGCMANAKDFLFKNMTGPIENRRPYKGWWYPYSSYGFGILEFIELCEKLGHPEDSLKFIHVGGTNGKGSTAAMLSTILEKAGYRVGLYTSPYIMRFNERMQINHQQIPDDELAVVTEHIRPIADAMEDVPTEFELNTALAMEYFCRNNCDIVVLEVGMGGELDSTNVIGAPEVAIITAMGFDHVAELGPTMADIARAKAGIIKDGCTVVSYGGNPEADDVIAQTCVDKGATLRQPNFAAIVPGDFGLEGQTFSYKTWQNMSIPLVGEYQMNNAAVVLETIGLLREKGWNISDENVREGMSQTRWPARFEILQRDPVFIVDGGHNPQCIEALVTNIRDYLTGRKVIALTGVLADKDYGDMYKPVMPYVSEFVCITPPNPRKMEAAVLAGHLNELGAKATACESVTDGVKRAMALAGPEGVVLCFGSLYTIGIVRDALEQVLSEK